MINCHHVQKRVQNYKLVVCIERPLCSVWNRLIFFNIHLHIHICGLFSTVTRAHVELTSLAESTLCAKGWKRFSACPIESLPLQILRQHDGGIGAMGCVKNVRRRWESLLPNQNRTYRKVIDNCVRCRWNAGWMCGVSCTWSCLLSLLLCRKVVNRYVFSACSLIWNWWIFFSGINT